MIYYLEQKLDNLTYLIIYELSDEDIAIKFLHSYKKKYPTRQYRIVKLIAGA